MSELRLLLCFVAGMLTPLAPYLAFADASTGDVFFGIYLYLLSALPAGLVAGIVAAITAPRAEGRLGWFLAALGVFVGTLIMSFQLTVGTPQPLADAALVATPIAVALSLGFGMVRLLQRRGDWSRSRDAGTSTPEPPSREP